MKLAVMARAVLIIFPFFAIAISLRAEPVSRETASLVAKNFFRQAEKLEKAPDIMEVKGIAYNGTVTRYAVNFKQGGFVLLAADDRVTPVLGYSRKNHWNENSVFPSLRVWLEQYDIPIKYCIDHDLSDSHSENVWNELRNNDLTHYSKYNTYVDPLIQTHWGMGHPYNALCPEVTGGDGNHVEVGCAALSTSQLLKYYGYPQYGIGSHSYNDPVYGLREADFDHYYNWTEMPNVLISGDEPGAIHVQRLLADMGTATDINYGPLVSSSNIVNMSSALLNHFQYTGMFIMERTTDNIDAWINRLKFELDHGHPVLYAAQRDTLGSIGHVFICDGYNEQGLFSFNWGMGGEHDGEYFNIGLDTDLHFGDIPYHYYHQMIIYVSKIDGSKIIAPVGAEYDLFAQAVAANEDYLAATGIIHHGTENLGQPCVEIYEKMPELGLRHINTIPTPDLENNQYGFDLCIDNDRMVLGAPFSNVSDLHSGQVAVYDDFYMWVGVEPDALINPPPGVFGFGSSIDIDGDYCIVGANMLSSLNNGRAFIYHYEDNGTWQLQSELVPDVLYPDTGFGITVAISGSYAIVSDRYRTVNGIDLRGGLLIYRRELNNWVLDDVVENPYPNDYILFGTVADIYGDHLLIGTGNGFNNPINCKAFMYKRTQVGWELIQEFIADGGRYDITSLCLNNGSAVLNFNDEAALPGFKSISREIKLVDGTWIAQRNINPNNQIDLSPRI